MTQLELHQRGLLDLIKSRGACPEDPYLRRVAESRGLAMIRGIALWWRGFQLEAQSRFTSRLLKRMGCFDTIVAAYFDGNETSPFVEELTHEFLASLRTHPDPLVRAVSQFELAFLAVRAGSKETFEVVWDRHPDRVILALDNGADLPAPEPDGEYHMCVAAHLPGMISCTREFTLQAES